MVTKSVDSNGLDEGITRAWDRLKVALVQYELEGGLSAQAFLQKLEQWLLKAHEEKAKLVVFPELFTADLLPGGRQVDPTKPIGLGQEIEEWNRITDREVPALLEGFELLSQKFSGMAILFGSTPRRLPSGSIVNTALFALGDGRVVLQDKLFLTPCEDREWLWQNGQNINVIDAPWGRTVIYICHDIEVPYLSSKLVEIQPDLILAPSCTGSIHGLRRVRFCAQARAVEHHAWVLQTSTIQPPLGQGGVATVNMNEHTGQAAIIPPSESLYEDFRKEGELNAAMMLVGEVDLRRMRKTRAMPVVFPARDERARSELPGVSAQRRATNG
jgi:predicted amidohydrolase